MDVETLSLDSLPLECQVEIFAQLAVGDLLSCSEVSHALHEVAFTDYLWRNLCVQCHHGQALDFNESLGMFKHPDAKPLASEEDESLSSTPNWCHVFRRSRDSLRTTVCIDGGRGYAKYGLACQGRPSVIQICQPGAEASAESMYALVFRRLGLRRTALPSTALILSEPFKLAAEEMERERLAWRFETERRLLQGFQLKAVAIVDSASLCLFARSFTSGVVVNIGFGVTYVVPVLRGHIIRQAVCTLRIGGAALTSFFQELCHIQGVDTSWSPYATAPYQPRAPA